jgi:hypothetical protein
MEPIEPPVQNFKAIIAVVWIALITAIIVTIIDWKLKQDILRLTDAFYRIYPATMEEQHEAPKVPETVKDSPRRRNSRSVRSVPVVDNDAGVEEKDANPTIHKDPEDHSDAWKKFAPDLETGLES